VTIRRDLIPPTPPEAVSPWRLVTWTEISARTDVLDTGGNIEAPIDESTHSLRMTGNYSGSYLQRGFSVPCPWPFAGPDGEFHVSLEIDAVPAIEASLSTDTFVGAGDLLSTDLPCVNHTLKTTDRSLRTRPFNVVTGSAGSASSATTIAGAGVPRILQVRGRAGNASVTQRCSGLALADRPPFPASPDFGGISEITQNRTTTTQAITSLGLWIILGVRNDSVGSFAFDLPIRIYCRDPLADGLTPTV